MPGAAGGCTIDDPTLLVSGVMMGGVTRDVRAPIAKTTAGLIVLPADHYLVRRKTAPRETYTRIGHGQCDQCSLCTELCPAVHPGVPDRATPRDAHLVDDRRGEGARQLVGAVLLRVQCLLTDRVPRVAGPEEHLRRRQALLRPTSWDALRRSSSNCSARPIPRNGREIPITTLIHAWA